MPNFSSLSSPPCSCHLSPWLLPTYLLTIFLWPQTHNIGWANTTESARKRVSKSVTTAKRKLHKYSISLAHIETEQQLRRPSIAWRLRP
ncbi:hypothetical protein YC2023_020317 [Brassica napus]